MLHDGAYDLVGVGCGLPGFFLRAGFIIFILVLLAAHVSHLGIFVLCLGLFVVLKKLAKVEEEVKNLFELGLVCHCLICILDAFKFFFEEGAVG